MNNMPRTLRCRARGIATIPIILVFGLLIVVVGVSITALSVAEGVSSQGTYQATRAYTYAEAGARDALERVARNKNYMCATTDCYSLAFSSGGCSDGSACAYMSVSSAAGTSANPKIITARGQAGANNRTLQVSVIFDSAAQGAIATTTWQELTK